MTKRVFLKFFMSIFALFFLAACGGAGYSVPAKESQEAITADKNKGYVIFATERIGNFSEPIFEYFPDTQEFKPVTILGNKQRFVYPVNEGVHYFYSMGGESYDFVKVEVQKGKKYYVHIESVFWSLRMTTPLIFVPATKDIIEEIDEDTTLVTNSPKVYVWYEKRKSNPKFKAKVKSRFEEWKANSMKEKTIPKESGI